MGRTRLPTLCLVAIATLCPLPSRSSEVRELPTEGESLRLVIDLEKEARFRFRLEGGEFLHLVVDQVSADVELHFAREGDPTEPEKPRNYMPWAWGEEELFLLPSQETSIRFEVRSAGTRSGEVILRVRARRPASARDRAVFEAESALLRTRTKRARSEVDDDLVTEALRAAELFADLGLPGRRARALARASTLLILLGRPRDAIEPADRAIEIAREAGDAFEECDARLKRAEAVFSIDPSEALAEERRILDRVRESPAPPCELMTRRILVYDLRALGRLEEALEIYRHAIRLAVALDAPWEQAGLHLNVSAVHKALGDPLADLAANAEAQRLYESLGDESMAASARSNIASVLFDLQDFEAALRAQEGILPTLEARGETHQLALELILHGRALGALGRGQEARRTLSRAIEIADGANEPRLVAQAERLLGGLELAAGEVDAARDRFERSLEASEAMGLVIQAGEARLGLADAHARSGDLDEALAASREVSRIARRVGNVPLEIEAGERATRLLRASRSPGAAEELARTLRLTEGVRSRIPSGRLQGSYTALQRRLYDLAIEMELDGVRQEGVETRLPDPEAVTAAFLLSERVRARSLRDDLEGARRDSRARIDPDLVERERQAFDRLAELEAELRRAGVSSSGPTTDAGASELRREIARIEVELEGLVAERTRRHPRQGAFLSGDLPSLDEMRRALRGAPLVAFHLMEDRGLAFLLTSDDLRLVEVPGRAELAPEIDAFLEVLARPSRRLGPVTAPARRLWDQLLAPLLGDFARNPRDGEDPVRLVVSPDGPLHRLPFEALRTTRPNLTGPTSSPDSNAFLVETFDITYVPSAATLVLLGAGPRGFEGEVIVWADPAGSEDDTGSGDVPPALGVAPDTGRAPLPWARAEARALAGVFGPERTEMLFGPSATESFARSARASRAAILHFAAHGRVDPSLASQSSLLLAPDAEADGILQMREVLRLDIGAELVTLSACRSADGRLQDGEGVLSLARAFFFAGASSLVASLWEVSDRTTAELMEAFYIDLRDDVGPSAALRRAKLRLLERPETAHPYYWAPFLFSGSPDPAD